MAVASKALTALALVLLVAANVATATWSTCPAMPTQVAYYDIINCSSIVTCATELCSCVGGTFNSATIECTTGSTTCANGETCARAYLECWATAAYQAAAAVSNTTDNCLSFGFGFHFEALAIAAAPATYNESDIYAACKAQSCGFYNSTTFTDSCTTIPYDTLCDISTIDFTPFGSGASWVSVLASAFVTVVSAAVLVL